MTTDSVVRRNPPSNSALPVGYLDWRWSHIAPAWTADPASATGYATPDVAEAKIAAVRARADVDDAYASYDVLERTGLSPDLEVVATQVVLPSAGSIGRRLSGPLADAVAMAKRLGTLPELAAAIALGEQLTSAELREIIEG